VSCWICLHFTLFFNLQVQWCCLPHHYFMKRSKSASPASSSIIIAACPYDFLSAARLLWIRLRQGGAVSYHPLSHCILSLTMPEFMVDKMVDQMVDQIDGAGLQPCRPSAHDLES
jgi:hypothetical protein